MPERYVGCSVRWLPPHMAIEAARTAVRVNPANAPLVPPSLAPLPAQRIALLTSKYWGAGGVDLSVQFLDGPDAETRRKVLLHANRWGERGNVRFRETQGQGQVRVARTPGQGYYSYLGTDVLHIPAGEQTMNLDSFTSGTPDSEYSRVVEHEFGHTLGWPHEHTRKEIVSRIDPAKAIAYFARNDGWDEQTVREQVLTPLSDSDITALPTDVLSIMCYSLPGEITVDGRDIPGGTQINDEDFALCARQYPKSDTGGGGGGGGPTPPGPPAGKLFTLTFSRPVRKGGRVTFSTPVAVPQGRYDFVPEAAAGQAEAEAEAGE